MNRLQQLAKWATENQFERIKQHPGEMIRYLIQENGEHAATEFLAGTEWEQQTHEIIAARAR